MAGEPVSGEASLLLQAPDPVAMASAYSFWADSRAPAVAKTLPGWIGVASRSEVVFEFAAVRLRK